MSKRMTATEIECLQSIVEAEWQRDLRLIVEAACEAMILQLGELSREPSPDVVSVEKARRHAQLTETPI